MKSTLLFFSLAATFIGLAPVTQAADTNSSVATLTQVQGKTQIFTHPADKLSNESEGGAHVLFEGKYYQIRDAKVGDKVEKGNILRTLPGGQTQVVYNNGDQFYVGPGSAYQITWDDKPVKGNVAENRIQLMYGRLRGVVAKEGPRSKLQIHTKTATMGVRGTDFFIADTGLNGETEVSVLRGSVSVKPNPSAATEKAAPQKAIEVKTGQSASVEVVAGNKEAAPVVETRETTKEDLSGIQKASTLPAPQGARDEKIVQLEKKAVQVTVKDIQTYQPELYNKMSTEEKKTVDPQALNNKLVALVAVNAPSAPPKRRKPRITELKDADDTDFYDQYFKVK